MAETPDAVPAPVVSVTPLEEVPQQQTSFSAQATYTVVPGESLDQVAARYRVTPESIAVLNNLQPPYELTPGQRLLLPPVALPGDSVASTPAVPAPGLVSPTAAATATPIVTDLPPITPVAPTGGPAQLAQPPAVDAPAQTVPIATAEAPDTAEAATLPGPIPADPAASPNPAPAPETVAAPQDGQFLWPLVGPIVSEYGPTEDGLNNDGVNISADRGTTIRAAQAGTVAYAGNELRGYGNLVLIRHADGWVTAYAHADSIMVQRGQEVQAGQPIATVGDTGSVTTPQLHFEIRQGSDAIDPMTRLPAL
ncbi:MAG: M23 family metallopeptidase [Pseudomonadota bacterium]